MRQLLRRTKRRATLFVKWLLRHGFFAWKTWKYTSPPAGQPAAVLMCLWNRPQRLAEMLQMLEEQDYPAGVELFLWNNKRADNSFYRSFLARYKGQHSVVAIRYVNSPFNLGSIARFYWAARIGRKQAGRPVIVVDDDQNIQASFVSTAISSFAPDRVVAWWAFRHDGLEYWERVRSQPGELVDFVGPGGMVCDSKIFADGEFFRGMPEKYWFLDDLWFTFYVTSRGYSLHRMDVDIDFVLEETNQYHGFIELKREFYRELRDRTARRR